MKIIIVSHGDLSLAMLRSAEMIVGPLPQAEAFGLQPAAETEQFLQQIEQAIAIAIDKKEEIVVFTDLFFGTPFNIVNRLYEKYSFLH